MDNKKAYMDPQTWTIECLKMYEISVGYFVLQVRNERLKSKIKAWVQTLA